MDDAQEGLSEVIVAIDAALAALALASKRIQTVCDAVVRAASESPAPAPPESVRPAA